MDSAEGKVVLVTGAGQACGRAIAEDFGARGASVVVNDIEDAKGQETVRRIEAAGETATFVHADVSQEAEVEALLDAAVASYGRLDIAVNNSGNELPVDIVESDAAQFARVIASNLEGVRACLKHEVRAMRSGGGGAILNMSSVTSDLTASPHIGLYGANKGGVDAPTKGTAVEVAKDNISINALASSAPTSRTDVPALPRPDGRAGRADPVGPPRRSLAPRRELCAAVRYLCSDEARFMTGTTVVLDGGFTAL